MLPVPRFPQRRHRFLVDAAGHDKLLPLWVRLQPNSYVIMAEFSRHVEEPVTAYDGDPQGPFTNTTREGSTPTCSPELHASINLETTIQDERASAPYNIPLQYLKDITDNFSDKRILGRGGIGVVYKGMLQSGQMIAVKRIMPSLMSGPQKQFESEVCHIMQLKHPNIVQCVGYSYETRYERLEHNREYIFAERTERLICLEYMPKGSLDKYLSDASSGLDWSTRYSIIRGICYGLRHLHEEIEMPIIHLDLKPPNILLDEDMVPKITDFGLSRLAQQQTICTSSRDGTFGYMAPEFLHRGIITSKSDIFSLGVIILEVVTGHRDYPDSTTIPSDDFIELALEKWRNVLQRSPGYVSLAIDCEQIKRCIQVGLICMIPDRNKRPTILKIINMIQGLESVDSVTVAKPSNKQSVDSLRLSTLYRKGDELIGTHEKSLEVIKMLMEGEKVFKKQLKVVSIVGSGGLGKTTVANVVYEKLKVQLDIEKENFQFECRAFVCVYLYPDMEKVFKSMLHQLGKQKYENINEATCSEVQLTDQIRTFLANKRYLIVIDDIHDNCVWEKIKHALPENEYGSRVIITARILDVAQQAGRVYRLKPLSVADSRKLFYRRIYETEDKSPPNHLVQVSENILERCGGMPLAIITIGGLLSSNEGRAHTYEYWSSVYKSICSGLHGRLDEVATMGSILSLCYSELPPHLKTCLLHLSLYPKIETGQLIWKWVNEGFVKKELGRSIYDVGAQYFKELVNRSLVQFVQFDSANEMHSCCAHRMVRELFTLSNKDNFITTVHSQQQVCLPSEIGRPSMRTGTEELACQLPTISSIHMRSLALRKSKELLQRYSASTGGAIIIGCIPYRVGGSDGELEVLMINSRKGYGKKFPKSGWMLDESMDEAARRSAFLKAGVRGHTGPSLGRWLYQSRHYDETYEGFMYPLRVTDELERWPEMAYRKRTWATTQQVMDGYQHLWMREALERLVARLASGSL